MDEAWGEDSSDTEGWDVEALRAAIDTGLNKWFPTPADQVFAELPARYAAKSYFAASGHPAWRTGGLSGLSSLVRDAGSDRFSGTLYVFRAKLADRSKPQPP